MTIREQAIQSARERRSIGYNEEGACEHALRAFPSVKLSRDQLKALAFGATLYGMGKPMCPGCAAEDARRDGGGHLSDCPKF